MHRVIAIASVASVTMLAARVASSPFDDGAPPGYTGGFGEETCHSCHFDRPLNDSAGSVTISGLPHVYSPDSLYRLAIGVTRSGLGRAGFSLSARFEDGTQAGVFKGPDSLLGFSAGPSGVTYATHTSLSSQVAGDSAAWALDWQAPSEGSGPVQMNLAANAANGDDSEFGDLIYARAYILRTDSR